MNAQTSFDRKAGILLKSISNFSNADIRKECQILFSEVTGNKITSTCFKRCVMYLDYMENRYEEKS